MNYELRHYNTPLLRFSATEDSSVPDINILWWDEAHRDLLPLDLRLTNEGLTKWLKQRTIPKNRAYVHIFLSKCGLNLNRPMSIIKVSKGLSLNDCYWVVDEGFGGTFEDYCKGLGEDYIKALRDMLVLDAVICNTDRHFGNFGFLIENSTNRIIALRRCLITEIHCSISRAPTIWSPMGR